MRRRRSGGPMTAARSQTHGWASRDSAKGYPLRIARKLLIEFVGGERGEMLRDQFA